MLKKGRVWLFEDDIDTDQIYPGKYLPLTDKEEMAQHAMEGAQGGAVFLKNVKKGDIIVAGKNFGCGSSREHAAVAIKGAGIAVVIARSFARIFRRNAVNTGLAIVILEQPDKIEPADILEVDVQKGKIKNLTRKQEYDGRPLSDLELEIMNAGGLLDYLAQSY